MRMDVIGRLLLLLAVGLALGDTDTDGTSEAAARQQDKLQDEILKAMKDSGVLNEWKEKLDDILYKDNEVNVKDKVKKKEKKSMLTKQERDMLFAFVDAYIQEHQLPVSTDLILRIVDRAQKTPAPNLPQLFVQLGPVIDVLSAVAKKTNDIEKIVERQAPVLDSPSKPKDVLHTLAENLKSELVRLTLDTPPPPKKKSPPPPPPPKKEKKKTGLDMSDYLTLGSTLLKGGNAGQLLNMLSGEADMASMINLLPSLIASGNYKDLLFKMVNGYLEGTPWGPIIQKSTEDFMESEYGKGMLEKGYTFLETFATSESGIRLMDVAPKMFAAKDLESFLAILSKEAEWNWSKFFSNIDNTDYKDMFTDKVAEYVIQAYEAVMNPPRGSMMAKAPILLNGFLISYRIPAFDSKKPTESLTAIVNKCIKLFTTWKLDVSPYMETASTTIQGAFQKQMKGNKFGDLDYDQKKALISRSLDTELMQPLQTVWMTFNHVSEAPECSAHLLCAINQREFKSGLGESRQQVVKGASLAAAWALSQNKCEAKKATGEMADKEKYWELYKAVWSGAKGEDCATKFPTKDKKCNLFSWQSKNYMNTQYDHVEL